MTTAIRVRRALLWLIYAWVIITLVLLLLAFFLLLFGADPSAGFVQWVYRSTERAMAPFRGIFEPIVLSDQSVLDTSVLFAMIVYGFVAIGLRLGLDWVTQSFMPSSSRSTTPHAPKNGRRPRRSRPPRLQGEFCSLGGRPESRRPPS